MILVRLIEYLRARLQTVVRICFGLLALLIALDAIPAIVDKHHAHTWIEHFPGFWSVFGFVGCVVIVFASKAFGHAGINRREDYYDE
jgi:hypothetical protein